MRELASALFRDFFELLKHKTGIAPLTLELGPDSFGLKQNRIDQPISAQPFMDLNAGSTLRTKHRQLPIAPT